MTIYFGGLNVLIYLRLLVSDAFNLLAATAHGLKLAFGVGGTSTRRFLFHPEKLIIMGDLRIFIFASFGCDVSRRETGK